MIRSSAAAAMPPTEYGSDGLVNRDSFLDSFTRPIFGRRILFTVRPNIVEEVEFSTSYHHDTEIRDSVNRMPDLSVLVNSLVFVKVKRTLKDGSYECVEGSGVRVSQKAIFTCAHNIGDNDGAIVKKIEVFISAQDMKRNEGGLIAEIIPLDPALLALYHKPGITSNDQFWSGQDPDFAVLRIRDHYMLPKGQFLSVPTHFDLPKPRLSAGEIVCMAGLPQTPTNPALCLRSSLILAIQDQHPETWEEIAEKIVRNDCFEFRHPMVSFGAIDRLESDHGQDYVASSASTMSGMSGGPVVNLASPTQLLGLVVAGATQGLHSVFIRADHPLIIESFKKYCD